ncbi:MAG: polysaccharide deacetylase family protein, partial [Candidatus Omnitrophica bacterium]|nr:polysaccharide deacetylase family protein [Candidatus Omnitrophota bacterium]
YKKQSAERIAKSGKQEKCCSEEMRQLDSPAVLPFGSVVPKLKSAAVMKLGSMDKFEGSYESNLERAIQILKSYREEEIEEILSELSRRWGIDEYPSGRAFLTWEEVREMAASGLITFGSHTATHRILTNLKDDEIQDELIRSKEKLIAEKVVDKSFIPFCYPNGNYNENIARLVKEAGYSLAVTTEKGWNRFNSNPFALKRIGIHQDMTSTEAMFLCKVANIF